MEFLAELLLKDMKASGLMIAVSCYIVTEVIMRTTREGFDRKRFALLISVGIGLVLSVLLGLSMKQLSDPNVYFRGLVAGFLASGGQSALKAIGAVRAKMNGGNSE